MASPSKGAKGQLPAADAQVAETPSKPKSPRALWTYGVNEHVEEPSVDALKAFKASGNLRADFEDLCRSCGIVPHAAFSAPRIGYAAGAATPAEGSTLAVQSMLVDRASLRVLKHVLPTSLHLEVLRLSGCRLDAAMLGLLRAGLALDACTVTTLQIDWNSVEAPADSAETQRIGADGTLEELDELERQRERKEADSALQAFKDQLEAVYGDVATALKEVASAADPNFVATAVVMPLDLATWTSAFERKLSGSTEDVTRIFYVIDGPFYGHGDGLVSLHRCEEILQGLPAPTPEEEAANSGALAFAAFVDATSPLELVSFRYCSLGRIEAQCIAKAMRGCQFLKALNLWGNRICDRGVGAIAEALEGYFGLQFLGLGRNLVTHVGLQRLAAVLGTTRIDEKEQADPLIKSLKDQLKDKEKKMKTAPVPKKDGRGRERYMPEAIHVDTCEERQDPNTGQTYWLRTRNTALRTLVLENNPISDAAAVHRLIPFGVGDLVLRGTPCAEELLRVKSLEDAAAASETADAAAAALLDAAADAAAPPGSRRGSKGAADKMSPTGGWNLILK